MRRMTPAALDALERRCKASLLFFGSVLMVDLACIGTLPLSGLASFACWLIAAVSVLVCAYALRELRRSGYREATGGYQGYRDFDPTDIVSTLTDLADHD